MGGGNRIVLHALRTALATAFAAAVAALAMPSGALASFGVTEANFEAGTCIVSTCEYSSPPSELYTQAAGHPPFGITGFELNSRTVGLGREPEGALKRVRVDVPPGLAADPEALPKCSIEDFNHDECPIDTQVGENQLTVFLAAANSTITGAVYNLQQPEGLPLLFGIHVDVPPVANEHVLLEGHVAWWSDYHEYFEINNISKSVPVLKSKLIFNGRAGAGNFLTLPSVCSSSTTSHLEVESWEGAISRTPTHTPVGVEGCEQVPFKPSVEVHPATAASDQPDGATTIVEVPQQATETNTADIKDAEVTLPAGMTLNPSAAHGLQACSEAQIAIGSTAPVTCPAGSKVGTVTIETDLPAGSLAGDVYLGNPGGGPITGPPYTIYLDAESRYGVSVRLKGSVEADAGTGRLTATFKDNPQLPFGELILTANGGARAPLANPLACGTAHTEARFTPYTGAPDALASTPFTTSGCTSPLPFSLAQTTQDGSSQAGAYTAYTFDLQRADGQQYPSKVQTVLPAGLVGEIPSVPLCGEPQAQQGSCPTASQIGTATVSVGAGSEPYAFAGPVYLTGPYNGSPYGLSIPIEAAAGPFDLGRVITRVAVGVDVHSGRVTASSALPTIVGGVPLRLRSVSVAVNRAKFLLNPTNCGPLATESLLTSTFGATQPLSSPFQVGGCSSLPFKPTFRAFTSARTSKQNGAMLRVEMTQGAHEANLRSVVAQLPLQLPSRLTTLQKACPAATFEASPAACASARVGTATAFTPVLPKPLSGSAYLISHGGAAFPDLDLVLEEGGVRVILVGNTNIKNGVTTSTFASIPDVPVSKFTLELPTGPNSALSAFGNLCLRPLAMPTTLTAQSGAQIKQSTRISVSGCGVRILSHRVRRHRLILKVRTVGGGLLTVTGRGLRRASKRVSRSCTVTFRLPLTHAAASRLRRHRHRGLKVTVRVLFRPSGGAAGPSAASATVRFRR